MRHILRRREVVADDWLYAGEQGVADSSAVIVSCAGFKADTAKWLAHGGRLGVRLSPADAIEDLGAHVARLSLVAAEFPAAGEGRGYTQGRLARSRLHFAGELRAVGAAVKQDLLFIMSRCGFDSFELAAGQNVAEAQRSLERYSVAHQPAEPVSSIKQQRFFAAG